MGHGGWFKAYLGLCLFAVVGQSISALTGMEAIWPARITSLAIILLAVGLIVADYRQAARTRWFLGVILVFSLGLTSELVGLATGFPFGSYTYPGTWWPSVPLGKLGTFPVALPFAWFLIAGGSYGVCSAVKPGLTRLMGAAALATGVDFFMEPIMIQSLRYWEWTPPGPFFGAAFMNPLGWFMVSFAAAAVLQRAEDSSRRPVPRTALVLGAYCLLIASFVPFQPRTSSDPIWGAVGCALIGVTLCAQGLKLGQAVPTSARGPE